MKLIDPIGKTNWKFLSIFVFLSIVVGGIAGYFFLTQKPSVEKIVYTEPAWYEDAGRVRNLIVANADGTGRKILLEKMPVEFPGISAAALLVPERREVIVITQDRIYPYGIDVEKIHTETGQRTKLGTHKEGGIHGMSLLNAILSPDKKKIAFTIRKHLFILDITEEKLVTLKPFYTETQLREGEGGAIEPVFWDSLGNIYLKSFETRTGENKIIDFIKVNSRGEKEELNQEQKAFFKVPSFESGAVDFRLYSSPDGKFAAWITTSEEDTFSQKISVYSTEKRWWVVRLKKDSMWILEGEEAINFQESIAGVQPQLYVTGTFFSDSRETVGFVSGIPIAGWEKDSREKVRDRQEAEFQAFKKISLYPEYLPSGWVKESERGHGLGIILEFRNANAKSDSSSIYKDSLSIFQEKQGVQIPQEFYVFRDYVSHYPKNRIATQENVSIGSSSGLYFTGDYLEQILAWSAEGLDMGISCSGGCSLKKEELIKIANSMKSITTLQQGSEQANPTAGWQTYRNDEFGFEIKYPLSWTARKISLENLGTVIEIENQQTNSSLSILQNNNPKNLSLDEWFREATVINGRPTAKAGAKPVTINGARAYRIDTELPPPNPYFEIVGIADEQQHIFTIHADYKVLEDGEVLNQILSTFRFVETYQSVAQKEAEELVARVSQLIVLPEGEIPTITTVVDVEKLKDQLFFANAKNGDKVLIYTNAKKAILYDPVRNKVVKVSPLNTGNP